MLKFLKRQERIVKTYLSIDPHELTNIILNDFGFQKFILDLVREDQLFKKGEDGLGRKLRSEFAIGGKVYATFTEVQKQFFRSPRQPIDRVTLKDSGAFYESFRLELSSTFFQIKADTLKESGDLKETWGENILTLNDENLQRVIDKIRDEIVPMVKRLLLAA